MGKGEEGSAALHDMSELTSLFHLLSDRTRLSILLLLSGGEQNVTHLCKQLGLPQPTVSHHLGLLRTSQIVGSRRSGKQVFYSLNGQVLPASGGTLRLQTELFEVKIGHRATAVAVAGT